MAKGIGPEGQETAHPESRRVRCRVLGFLGFRVLGFIGFIGFIGFREDPSNWTFNIPAS